MRFEIPIRYWYQIGKTFPDGLQGWVGNIPVEFQLWIHLEPVRDGDPFVKIIEREVDIGEAV